ncbi:hypothetical protein Pst134EA_000849 [Puccinia striiformis f. sp. tritici]|uniref:hypothetical protein n=1 Tax=Puccinia striiformis f. sp. tritici TaxID=168172 RepID=UPI002008E852|nr:hypothetical protein Pst134EA_000849 [Puccinia striiformis f. sp. tritici]KAH9473781.1 hypothetical protein Pst134EA_000849 [Puccinia striiformis f. sp. tritici]
MVCRKRQRPSASDFFGLPPPEAPVIEKPLDSIDADFGLAVNHQRTACPLEYLSELESLEPHQRILELIRGNDKIEWDASIKGSYLYVVRSDRSEVKIEEVLELRHIATLLWGPGKREVTGGKTIHSGHLCFKVDDSRTITTDEVYAIEFPTLRSAEIAGGIVEFHLNRFLASLVEDAEKPLLQVQTKIGSPRWFIENPTSSMTESKWQVVRRQIPFLRPIVKREKSPATMKNPLAETNPSAFEISQLPPGFTIPLILQNLTSLQLLALPIQIKLTEENRSLTPIRVLLRFTDRMSAVVCKINLFKVGLKTEEKEAVKFLVDDGDSSIEDTWQIWRNGTVWDEETIQSFVKSRNHEGGKKSEDEIDELKEDTKIGIEGSECPDVTEFLESSDDNRPRKGSSTRSYLERLQQRQKETESKLEKLTLEYEKKNLMQNSEEDGQPRSKFYDVSEQVGDDKKYKKLMKALQRKKSLRRQLKQYRKTAELPIKVKQQRKQWRKEQRQKFREDDVRSEEVSSGADSDQESDESDQPDQQQLASCSNEEWERIRKKQRVRRVMEEKENSPNAEDENGERRIYTNDEIYRRKFARPNEPLPGDVD